MVVVEELGMSFARCRSKADKNMRLHSYRPIQYTLGIASDEVLGGVGGFPFTKKVAMSVGRE